MFSRLRDILKTLPRFVAGIAVATPGGGSLRANNDPSTILDGITGKAIDYLSIIGGAIALIFVIWNGIRYIQSNGDTKKAEEARKGVVAAVIGVVLLVLARFLIALAVNVGTDVATDATITF